MNIETLKNLVIEKKKIVIPIGSILILLLILGITGKLDDLLSVIATITIAISGVVGALLIFISAYSHFLSTSFFCLFFVFCLGK